MYFLNLTLIQFAAVFGSLAALSVALYLLDRSRRKQVVSTLRFWVSAEQPAAAARRRHLQQPWSLILQLVGMALLVAALAQLRLGSPLEAGRDHVLVLDTSAWMSAASGSGTLMDLARQRARQYVRALPARDRVMLVRAGAEAMPATGFEPSHAKLEAAIRASVPDSTALHLDDALAFAHRIQAQEGRRAGEIAFIGAGRTATPDPATPPAAPPNLRAILIPDAIQNCGLRKIGVRRSSAGPDVWEIFVSVHNSGVLPRTVTLSVDFGPPQAAARVPVGVRLLRLQPGADTESSFTWHTASAGILGVTLAPHDAFPLDDHAELELPAEPSLAITVYSSEPDLLRPVLASTPRLAPVYRKPEEYRPDDKGLVILDRFAPHSRPAADAIWIDPPAEGSPIPIRAMVENVPFAGWDSGGPLSLGLRARDFKLERASVFETAPTDIRIGELEAGAVIVARPAKPKIAVFGFHPALSGMRYELATPLVFANLLRWFSPELFRRAELSASSVGAVKLETEQPLRPSEIKVTARDGSDVPFTLDGRAIDFFAGEPGAITVVAGDREYRYSLTLPEPADARWTPPAGTRRGLPHFAALSDATQDLWPWLALAGGCALLAEYLLFGRFSRRAARPVVLRARMAQAKGMRQ